MARARQIGRKNICNVLGRTSSLLSSFFFFCCFFGKICKSTEKGKSNKQKRAGDDYGARANIFLVILSYFIFLFWIWRAAKWRTSWLKPASQQRPCQTSLNIQLSMQQKLFTVYARLKHQRKISSSSFHSLTSRSINAAVVAFCYMG